jgi:hypothetical protein
MAIENVAEAPVDDEGGIFDAPDWPDSLDNQVGKDVQDLQAGVSEETNVVRAVDGAAIGEKIDFSSDSDARRNLQWLSSDGRFKFSGFGQILRNGVFKIEGDLEFTDVESGLNDWIPIRDFIVFEGGGEVFEDTLVFPPDEYPLTMKVSWNKTDNTVQVEMNHAYDEMRAIANGPECPEDEIDALVHVDRLLRLQSDDEGVAIEGKLRQPWHGEECSAVDFDAKIYLKGEDEFTEHPVYHSGVRVDHSGEVVWSRILDVKGEHIASFAVTYKPTGRWGIKVKRVNEAVANPFFEAERVSVPTERLQAILDEVMRDSAQAPKTWRNLWGLIKR